MLERLELSIDRIKEIKAENKLQQEYQKYYENPGMFHAPR